MPIPTIPPDKRPTDKVAAGGATGAGVLVVLFIAQTFGLQMDAVTAAAIVGAAGWAAAWWKTERSNRR